MKNLEMFSECRSISLESCFSLTWIQCLRYSGRRRHPTINAKLHMIREESSNELMSKKEKGTKEQNGHMTKWNNNQVKRNNNHVKRSMR
uniref:Uncharacterized protein n=1 Tax=Arundo donax TaxID=35708 RepID=A0A0A9H8Z8_ARUDO